MRIARFLGKRLLFTIPQILGVMIITFLLIRLVPGDPAVQLLGPFATPEGVAEVRKNLALDKSVIEQFWIYLERFVQGDWGTSFTTGNPVIKDIGERLPATLELITIALVIKTILGVAIGVFVASRPKGISDRFTFLYGMGAGAFPDFWLGLVLSYIFFFKLGWVAAPVGRLDTDIPPPDQITGFYTVDSVLTGNWTAFSSAVSHLILPVTTLVLVYGGAIMKMTRATTREMLGSDFVTYARASGLSDRKVTRYALRNSLPPIVTMVGISYSFLLGGAVLVENVFSWGGVGQYATMAVVESDYSAIQLFIVVAALFNLVVYLIVDLIYMFSDPRMES